MKKTSILIITILIGRIAYSQIEKEFIVTENKNQYSENDTVPAIIYSNIYELSKSKVKGAIASRKDRYSEKDTIPAVVYPNNDQLDMPIFLINNDYVTFETSKTLKTLNPDHIESINIEKGSFDINGKKYNGKIIIKTKIDYKPKFILLNEFIAKYTKLKKDEKFIFGIDGEVMNMDDENMYIDEKNIMQIEVIKLDKTKNTQDVYFIDLVTRTAENLKKANRIYLRGDELSKE